MRMGPPSEGVAQIPLPLSPSLQGRENKPSPLKGEGRVRVIPNVPGAGVPATIDKVRQTYVRMLMLERMIRPPQLNTQRKGKAAERRRRKASGLRCRKL